MQYLQYLQGVLEVNRVNAAVPGPGKATGGLNGSISEFDPWAAPTTTYTMHGLDTHL